MELQQFIFLSLQITWGGHSHSIVFCEMFPYFCYYPRSPIAWLSVLQMNINASSFSYAPIGILAIPHIKGSAKTKVVIREGLGPKCGTVGDLLLMQLACTHAFPLPFVGMIIWGKLYTEKISQLKGAWESFLPSGRLNKPCYTSIFCL